MQSAIPIKSDKNNFTCTQYTDKEYFKTRLKQRLADRYRRECYSLLARVSKSGMHSSFDIAVRL